MKVNSNNVTRFNARMRNYISYHDGQGMLVRAGLHLTALIAKLNFRYTIQDVIQFICKPGWISTSDEYSFKYWLENEGYVAFSFWSRKYCHCLSYCQSHHVYLGISIVNSKHSDALPEFHLIIVINLVALLWPNL